MASFRSNSKVYHYGVKRCFLTKQTDSCGNVQLMSSESVVIRTHSLSSPAPLAASGVASPIARPPSRFPLMH